MKTGGDAKSDERSSTEELEFQAKIRAYTDAGLPWRIAIERVTLENRLKQLPEAWGNELMVLVFGDFDAPEADIVIPSIELRITAEVVTNSVIIGPRTVLRAWIRMPERSVEGIAEVVRKLNAFVGAHSAVEWDNGSIGWASAFISKPSRGNFRPIEASKIDPVLTKLAKLQPDIHELVRQALNWIAATPGYLMLHHADTTFSLFGDYWSAFERLVEAVCIFENYVGNDAKSPDDVVQEYFAVHTSKITAGDIIKCNKLLNINTFRPKAEFAIRVCFPELADGYIKAIFDARPKENRLYHIRNSIAHGFIDIDDLFERQRIDNRFIILLCLVLGMLGRFLPFSYPIWPARDV